MTTALASSSHEIITPANVIQPRAFVIGSVAGLLTVASACIPSFLVRAAVSSCAVAVSTTAFDGRGDATAPVSMVEDKSPTLRLASTPIGAGRAFRFRGCWGRLFFMAYLSLLKTRYTGNLLVGAPLRSSDFDALSAPLGYPTPIQNNSGPLQGLAGRLAVG
jgi:hypothetical protein